MELIERRWNVLSSNTGICINMENGISLSKTVGLEIGDRRGFVICNALILTVIVFI